MRTSSDLGRQSPARMEAGADGAVEQLWVMALQNCRQQVEQQPAMHLGSNDSQKCPGWCKQDTPPRGAELSLVTIRCFSDLIWVLHLVWGLQQRKNVNKHGQIQ